MGRSFTARLVITVTVAAAVVIALGLFVDYQLSRKRIIANLEQGARSSIRAAALRITELTTGLESSARLLGQAITEVPDVTQINQLLGSVVDSNPHIFAASIALDPKFAASPDGFAPYLYRGAGSLVQTDLARAATPYWEEPWFRRTRQLGEAVWVEPYFAATGARVQMTTFSAPLYRFDDIADAQADNKGAREFIGVASIDLRLSDLDEYLDGLRLDNVGFGFILTSSGILLGAPEGPVISAPIEQVLQGFTGDDLSKKRSVLCPDGVSECQLRVTPANNDAWSLGVVYSEDALLRPLRDYALRVLAVGAAMLVLLAALVTFFTRRLTRPLLDLALASQSIARGELNVALPSVSGEDEVAQLVNAFDSMRRDLGQYITEIESAAAQRSRMDGELSAARDIQMAMLPQGGCASLTTGALELWARVRPAKAVGGDLYSFQRTGDQLLISIGDVSDKGIPAALFMARAISFIQQWEVQAATVPPEIALQQLNEGLTRDNDNCMFLTLFIGVLNLQTLELHYASAGHSAPVLLRDGRTTMVVQNRGPALGLQDGLSFPVNRLQLQTDDRLAIYTDGFDEAQNSQAQLLGESALCAMLAEPDTLPLAEAGEAIFAAADGFVGSAPQFDDMALMLLEVAGRRRLPLQAERNSLAINADLPGRAALWLQYQWQAQGLPTDTLHDMQLVLEEIVCNIRDHAQTGDGDMLGISLERFADRVELECVDPGRAYNPLMEAERACLGDSIEEASIGGLGVHLITQLTTRQFYRREEGRNILRVRLALAPYAERQDHL